MHSVRAYVFVFGQSQNVSFGGSFVSADFEKCSFGRSLLYVGLYIGLHEFIYTYNYMIAYAIHYIVMYCSIMYLRLSKNFVILPCIPVLCIAFYCIVFHSVVFHCIVLLSSTVL